MNDFELWLIFLRSMGLDLVYNISHFENGIEILKTNGSPKLKVLFNEDGTFIDFDTEV